MAKKRTKKKTPKPTVKKAHKIADAIKASGGKKARGSNPYAIGMAAAKKAAAKRKRQRASQ